MNTQEIQEWSEEFDERWYLWNLDGLAYTTCGEEVKSFISQKLKEQRSDILETVRKNLDDHCIYEVSAETLLEK
jgi:hypothetical protein